MGGRDAPSGVTFLLLAVACFLQVLCPILRCFQLWGRSHLTRCIAGGEPCVCNGRLPSLLGAGCPIGRRRSPGCCCVLVSCDMPCTPVLCCDGSLFCCTAAATRSGGRQPVVCARPLNALACLGPSARLMQHKVAFVCTGHRQTRR